MELQDIVDLLENRKRLVEMAFPLKQVREGLTDRPQRLKRFSHLVLIYYFRNEQEANHWKKELSAFVPVSPLVKGRNKRISKDETLRYLWTGFVEDDPIRSYECAFDYAKVNEDYNVKHESRVPLPWVSVIEKPESVLSFMEDFHVWASETLEKYGEVKSQETIAEIDELLKRYPLL